MRRSAPDATFEDFQRRARALQDLAEQAARLADKAVWGAPGDTPQAISRQRDDLNALFNRIAEVATPKAHPVDKLLGAIDHWQSLARLEEVFADVLDPNLNVATHPHRVWLDHPAVKAALADKKLMADVNEKRRLKGVKAGVLVFLNKGLGYPAPREFDRARAFLKDLPPDQEPEEP